jgi:hypothetical protein
MVSKINIKELFLGHQKEMIASLESFKAPHNPTVGDFSEEAWLKLFQDYLPNRYSAEKALVVDHLGDVSDAIDIVIFDALYTPFLLNKNGVKIVPAESVYAVFEVKQEISKANIEYAANKGESVRSLNRTSVKINNAGVTQVAKEHFEIITGLLCRRNDWANIEKAVDNGKTHILAQEGVKRLNLVCCLEAGSYSLSLDGKSVDVSLDSQALINFFYDLILRLQNNGTVPAMDIAKYIE